MNEQVREYIEKYPIEIIDVFSALRVLIFDNAPSAPTEMLWAKIPSYYVDEKFVRIIPFKDHVNVEASAILLHREELINYKITPKGMLQIYLKQSIPSEILSKIFAESLK